MARQPIAQRCHWKPDQVGACLSAVMRCAQPPLWTQEGLIQEDFVLEENLYQDLLLQDSKQKCLWSCTCVVEWPLAPAAE